MKSMISMLLSAALVFVLVGVVNAQPPWAGHRGQHWGHPDQKVDAPKDLKQLPDQKKDAPRELRGERSKHFGPRGMGPKFGPPMGPRGMGPKFGPPMGPRGMGPKFGPPRQKDHKACPLCGARLV